MGYILPLDFLHSQGWDMYSDTEKHIIANDTRDNLRIVLSDGDRGKDTVFRALQFMCYTI